MLLECNVAPEIARMVLPQSMMTEFIETGSLAAYARLCHLRLGSDAQKEIRDVARLVSDALAAAFPSSWKVLMTQ
jgi:thymidylate synthase (FAD)